MPAVAPSPADFYASAPGRVAAALVAERLQRFWPALPGLSVLGVGYPLPYLETWRADAERCVAAVLPGVGRAWPHEPGACLGADGALPFPDLCFDRVLLVHALERSDEPPRLLRDVWRVLRDGGRLIVVAPNRRGAWAHGERTPFGPGQPYSRSDLERLLAGHQFQVTQRDAALFAPPFARTVDLRRARAIDAAGRAALPLVGGVTLTEAVKEVVGVHPLLVSGLARAKLPRRVLVDAG